jgi:hypothetical protein
MKSGKTEFNNFQQNQSLLTQNPEICFYQDVHYLKISMLYTYLQFVYETDLTVTALSPLNGIVVSDCSL